MAGLVIKCYIEKTEDDKTNLIILTNSPRTFHYGVLPARIEDVKNPCIEALRFMMEYQICWELEELVLPKMTWDTKDFHRRDNEQQLFGELFGKIIQKVSNVTMKNQKFDPTSKDIKLLDGRTEIDNIDSTGFADICKEECWGRGKSCCDNYVPDGLKNWNYAKYLYTYGIAPLPVEERGGNCPFNKKGAGCIIPREHRPFLCRHFKCHAVCEALAYYKCHNSECGHVFKYTERAKVQDGRRRNGYANACPKCNCTNIDFHRRG